jgi:ATP-dependent helicase IRC3
MRKSTLVFCANLAHVHDLTNEFRRRGVDARYIHSRTPIKARKQLLDDFRAGAFQVLVNCAILTEGADVPNIDCVVVARPTRSRNIFAQMVNLDERSLAG